MLRGVTELSLRERCDLGGGDGMDLWSIGFVPPTTFTANEPWGNQGFSPAPISWQFVDHFIKYIVTRDPNFDVRSFDRGGPRIDGAALDLFDRRTEAGDADVPERLRRFLAQNRKLLVYHGFSDPALPAFRTIRHYEALARRPSGFDKLRENMRLFMAPGMHHCGGGPGPNLFDTLSALEKWVENGMAPDAIPATHFVNNNPALGVDRTMPLCAFPEEAQYSGSGNVNSAANWACTANQRLLEVGPNGRQAGLGEDDHGDDEDPGDLETWRRRMPALGITVSEETVRTDYELMDLAEFRRAYGCQWPEVAKPGWEVISRQTWEALGYG